jgi:hypothetical protein
VCARGTNALDNAVATLAATVGRQHGALSDENFAATRAAGLDNGPIIEIVANVAINVLTNCTNNVAGGVCRTTPWPGGVCSTWVEYGRFEQLHDRTRVLGL